MALRIPDGRGGSTAHQQILVDFGAFALGSAELNDLLNRSAAAVVEGLGVGLSRICCHDQASDELLVVAGRGWKADVVGATRLSRNSSSAYALRSGHPVHAPDIRRHPGRRHPGVTPDPFLKAQEVASLLTVPVWVGKSAWGILEAATTEPRVFSTEDTLLLQGLATLLGAAIGRIGSEARLRAVVDLVPDLLWRNDLCAGVSWYNRRWYEFTGQSEQEAAGDGWLQVVHPDDRQRSRGTFQQAVAQGEPLEQEVRIRGREGGYRWFLVRAVPVRNALGQVLQYVGSSTDIHDRRAAEEELRASEGRFRALADLSPDGILINAGDSFVYANPAALRILGAAAPEQILGRSPYEIILPDHHEQVQARISSCLAGRSNPLVEMQFRLPDGRPVSVEVAAAQVLWKGAPAVQVLLRDMTERRRAEQKLRESEARYRALFTSMDKGYLLAEVIFDEDRPTDIYFLEANPAARQIAGQDFVGRRLRAINPSYEPYWYEIFGRAARTGEATRTEKFSAVLNAWLDLYIFRVGGPEDRTVALIFRDVTERRRTEQALRQARDAADQANQAKSRFLAAASHDLRQPVTAAGLYIDLLSRRLSDPEHTTLADMVRVSLDGLRGLLNGLLEIARLEAGVVRPEIRTVTLDDLLQRLSAEFEAQARAARLYLQVPPTAVLVTTDPMLLEVILRNLIGNALKYTQHGGVIVEAIEEVEAVRIDVQDTGPGIPDNCLTRIFDDFFQASSTSGETKGYGIGLATVRRMCDVLGCRVEVRSESGRGSTFSVWLQRAVELEQAGEELHQPELEPIPLSLANQTVLVVDDDPMIGAGLKMALQEDSLIVVMADSVQSAQAALASRQRPVDLVLSDYQLGDGDGLDVVASARALAPTPAILFTGDTAPAVLRRANEAGIRLVHKPVQVPDLLLTIRELLSRDTACRPKD